jgi:hypothetical protein
VARELAPAGLCRSWRSLRSFDLDPFRLRFKCLGKDRSLVALDSSYRRSPAGASSLTTGVEAVSSYLYPSATHQFPIVVPRLSVAPAVNVARRFSHLSLRFPASSGTEKCLSSNGGALREFRQHASRNAVAYQVMRLVPPVSRLRPGKRDPAGQNVV